MSVDSSNSLPAVPVTVSAVIPQLVASWPTTVRVSMNLLT